MSAVSITINREPISRGTYDGASDAAKIQAEIFERLIELDAIKHDCSSSLCGNLATLYSLSPYAFRTVLRVGSGDLAGVLSSYEHMTGERGLIKGTAPTGDPNTFGATTKQSIHYELEAEIEKIRQMFPEIANVLHQYRDHATRHHRVQGDGESARDAAK